ncbi:hypothetical protein AB0L70_41480 [Kribbella sp. NPDC051952]|uniref:hypothetical protein n=1 Tax=Kribbella sp. NPDC051952 TaxID=3154851 RepID=UPI00341C9D59
MSFIVPGQGQKKEEAVGTQAGAKPLVPESIEVPAPEELPELEFDGWPEELRQVVEDEFRRTSAFATYRWKMADDALVAVVRRLDDLLDLIEEQLEEATASRKSAPGTSDLPFDEVADLLGIPADEVDQAIVDGRPVRKPRADRKTALRAIKQLRVQLEQIETTMDHSRLSRVSSSIVRPALVLRTAVELADDDALAAEVQPGVAALVAYALERSNAGLPDAWHDRKPATNAADSHRALLDALAAEDPTAFELLVRSARAWVACFDQERPAADKVTYWQALEELPDAIRANSAETYQALHKTLELLTPPTK